MQTVTRDKFFAALRQCQADIMPSIAHSARWNATTGYVSTWRNQRTGEIVGQSFGGGAQTYQLTEAFLEGR